MTRRTAFNGSAAGRRRERRASLQSEASSSSEVMHRPTESRVVLSCKRPAMSRVDKGPGTNRAGSTEWQLSGNSGRLEVGAT